jgi:ribonucleoside-diphosphate reductase alpha chain
MTGLVRERERLPNRRGNVSLSFEYESHQYRAMAGYFPDGRLAEIFLDIPGKMGTPVGTSADNQAILASIAMQFGAPPQTVQHAVTGPLAIALSKFLESGT